MDRHSDEGATMKANADRRAIVRRLPFLAAVLLATLGGFDAQFASDPKVFRDNDH